MGVGSRRVFEDPVKNHANIFHLFLGNMFSFFSKGKEKKNGLRQKSTNPLQNKGELDKISDDL